MIKNKLRTRRTKTTGAVVWINKIDFSNREATRRFGGNHRSPPIRHEIRFLRLLGFFSANF